MLPRPIRHAFGEDVSEKGFHYRHTAAYQTSVDFDHTGERVSVGKVWVREARSVTLRERSSRLAMLNQGR